MSLSNATLLCVALGASWISGHHELSSIPKPSCECSAECVLTFPPTGVAISAARGIWPGKAREARRPRSGRPAVPPFQKAGAVCNYQDLRPTTLGALFLCLLRLVKNRRLDYLLTALVAIALVRGGAISPVQTVQLWEFGREAKRWVGTTGSVRPGRSAGSPPCLIWSTFGHAQYSLTWKGVVGLVRPAAFAISSWVRRAVARGVPDLVLPVPTVAISNRHAETARPGLLAGSQTPVHRLLYEVLPMLERARNLLRGTVL